MIYDPVGRLVQTDTGSGFTIQRFGYDGPNLIAEYDVNNAVARRYVFGPGGEPVVWYEGSGTSTRRYFQADERGSVIAVTDGVGNLVGSLNRYDEYGVPQGTLTGRFGYTGQVYLSDSQLYDYRNRTYLPSLGRFLQADPIGYAAGMNLYAYVLGDPVNEVDPLGLAWGDIIVIGNRPKPQNPSPTPNPQFTIFINELLRASQAYSGSEPGSKETAEKTDRVCNATNVLNFIRAHSRDAAEIARLLNVPIENILGLSGQESGWGTGRFAVQGNNFFSLHGGRNAPFATGTMPAGNGTPMSTFPSYLASGRSFAAQYGRYVTGVPDPAAFAQGLIRGHFNSGRAPDGNPNFVPLTSGSIARVAERIRKCFG